MKRIFDRGRVACVRASQGSNRPEAVNASLSIPRAAMGDTLDRATDDEAPPIDGDPPLRASSRRWGVALASALIACGGPTAAAPVAATIAAPGPIVSAEARDEAPAAAIAPVSPPARDPPRPQLFPARSEQMGGRTAMTCGRYVVERRDDRGGLGHVRVIAPGGGVAYDARPRTGSEDYDATWCLDVNGDGTPELELVHSTGGAHCCHKSIVLTLGDHVETLVEFDAGNARGLVPRDVDGDGHLELVGEDDVLAVEGGLPFAFAPFLPVVFRVDRDRAVRRTRGYPRFLRAERDEAVRALVECDGDAICLESFGESILGLSLLIGDWDAEAGRISLPDPVRASLARLRKRLAGRLDR